jgi:hypothetical protein
MVSYKKLKKWREPLEEAIGYMDLASMNNSVCISHEKTFELCLW